ncbi:rod shape-determining protein MreC [Candidatus Velamenicoccus archaeovorus]|uniref:Cell shape-determining protein MreC n=1 Tax=Velamenicoccus archaeovorus TaxID=1930593 RepID=A0A410P550_VELA1|nr:rod shape-determining protein MreC [Candidatus Velamenicoccus archaeovorus]QAT17250.1 rod shape-determining protein MreC [Candidatus Velamenicoccus archaeovorus]
MFLANRKFIGYFFIVVLLSLLVFLSFRHSPYVMRQIFSDAAKLPLMALDAAGQEARALLLFHKSYWDGKKLVRENGGLKKALLESEELRKENTRLRDLLDLRQKLDYETTPASVIGRDFGVFRSYLVLDKGRAAGVKTYAPVITAAGLVGKVLETGQFSCKVILLNDPDLSVPAKDARSGEQGLVSGSLDGKCKLRFLDVNSDVVEGDLIVTSGLNMTYPAGIPIGRVKMVGMESSGLSKFAVIEPVLNLSCLDEVLIVTSFKHD